MAASKHRYVVIFLSCLLGFFLSGKAMAQMPDGGSVEVNGDVVEYSRQSEDVVAKGNVEVIYQDTTIYCDEVRFSRKTNIAYAKGNVLLKSPRGEVSGDQITFNYNTMQGEFLAPA